MAADQNRRSSGPWDAAIDHFLKVTRSDWPGQFRQ